MPPVLDAAPAAVTAALADSFPESPSSLLEDGLSWHICISVVKTHRKVNFITPLDAGAYLRLL